MALEGNDTVQQMESVQASTGELVAPADGAARTSQVRGVDVQDGDVLVELDSAGKTTLDVGLEAAGGDVDIRLQAGPDGSLWFDYQTWTGLTDLAEGYFVGAKHVRLLVIGQTNNPTVSAYLGVS